MTPYNLHLHDFKLFFGNRRTFKKNINCFPYFYNASNAFDIRFVLCLTLMCEMETAAVITLKGCEGKLRYQRSRY